LKFYKNDLFMISIVLIFFADLFFYLPIVHEIIYSALFLFLPGLVLLIIFNIGKNLSSLEKFVYIQMLSLTFNNFIIWAFIYIYNRDYYNFKSKSFYSLIYIYFPFIIVYVLFVFFKFRKRNIEIKSIFNVSLSRILKLKKQKLPYFQIISIIMYISIYMYHLFLEKRILWGYAFFNQLYNLDNYGTLLTISNKFNTNFSYFNSFRAAFSGDILYVYLFKLFMNSKLVINLIPVIGKTNYSVEIFILYLHISSVYFISIFLICKKVLNNIAPKSLNNKKTLTIFYILVISIAELLNNTTRYGRVILSIDMILFFLLIVIDKLFSGSNFSKKEQMFLRIFTPISLILNLNTYRTTGYIFFAFVFIWIFLILHQNFAYEIGIVSIFLLFITLKINIVILNDIQGLIHLSKNSVFILILMVAFFLSIFKTLLYLEKIPFLNKFYKSAKYFDFKIKKPILYFIISLVPILLISIYYISSNATNYGSMTSSIYQKYINLLVILNASWIVISIAFSSLKIMKQIRHILYLNKAIIFSILSAFVIGLFFMATQPGVSIRYLWIPSMLIIPFFIQNFKKKQAIFILKILLIISLVSLLILSVMPSPINLKRDNRIDNLINFINESDIIDNKYTIITSFDIGSEIAANTHYLNIIPIDSYTQSFKKYEAAFFSSNTNSVITLIYLDVNIVIMSSQWVSEGILGFISGYPPLDESVYHKFNISPYSTLIYSDSVYFVYYLYNPA